jgi:hypothetical protein
MSTAVAMCTLCFQLKDNIEMNQISHRFGSLLWITLLTSHLFLSLSQTCSEDGVCVAQDDVVIPKYANKDGKPVEASDDCFDRHEQCSNFVKHGECKFDDFPHRKNLISFARYQESWLDDYQLSTRLSCLSSP